MTRIAAIFRAHLRMGSVTGSTLRNASVDPEPTGRKYTQDGEHGLFDVAVRRYRRELEAREREGELRKEKKAREKTARVRRAERRKEDEVVEGSGPS